MWMRTGQFFSLVAVLFAFSYLNSAHAASCTSGGGGNWTTSGSLTYQRDQAIGTWGSNKFGTTNAYQFSCTADSADRDAYLILSIPSAPIAGYTDVYPTDLDGVGVRYNFALNSGDTSFCPVNFDDHIANSTRQYTCHFLANKTTALSFGASIEFIKVKSSVASGLITTIPRVNVSYRLNGESQTNNLPVMWSGNVSVNLTAVACSVTTNTIQVPLGNVYANVFTAVGTTANPTTFNLGLNCDARANVNMMMTGTQNSDSSTAGVLQLTNAGSASVASGIGVQILYNGNPLALNNNIVLKTSAGGQETFPLTARFYQTKSAITVGQANSTMTLNMTYQ